MGKSKWIIIISNSFTMLIYAILAMCVIIIISAKVAGGDPQFFGYQLKTVLSGSMEPGIKTGSIIAVQAGGDMTRFKENDIVTYKDDRYNLVTHRIVEIVKSENNIMYRTKGDHNDGPDTNLLLPENIVAEYKGYTVPYAGYFIEFLKSKNGNFVLFILPGILLILQSLIDVINLVKENRNPSADLNDSNKVSG